MLAYEAPWLPASGIRCEHTHTHSCKMKIQLEGNLGGTKSQLQNKCLTLQGDAVGAWISEKICAVVFPTPETIRKVGASTPCWPA